MLDKELFYFNLDIQTKEELLRKIGNDLVSLGYAKETFVSEILNREQLYPTGLPLSIGVAIPHVSTDHANVNKLIFVKPRQSISFYEMGNDETLVDVELVIVLLISDKDDHMKTLSGVVNIIQDKEILREIHEASTEADFERLIVKNFKENIEEDLL